MRTKICSECELEIQFDDDGEPISGGCGDLACCYCTGLDIEDNPQELDFSEPEELGIDREVPDPTVE